MDPKLIKAVRSQISKNKEDQDETLREVADNGGGGGVMGFTYYNDTGPFALKNAELIFNDLVEYAEDVGDEPIKLIAKGKGESYIHSWETFLNFMAWWALERVASEEMGEE